MIRIECQCGETGDLDESLAGSSVKCPACGRVHAVPEPPKREWLPVVESQTSESPTPSPPPPVVTERRDSKWPAIRKWTWTIAKYPVAILACLLILAFAGHVHAAFLRWPFPFSWLVYASVMSLLCLVAIPATWRSITKGLPAESTDPAEPSQE